MENFKNKFINNYQNYLEKSENIRFKNSLEEINTFIKTTDIQNILKSIKAHFTEVKSKFFIDDNINLL